MKVGQALGHYHVIRTLGKGGMGAVYEASDTRLNRQVALKVLPAKMANNPEWFKRFEREAQAVASLNHPNIVTIHSVEEADDVHFIILELVGGETVDELIPDDGMPLGQFFDVAIPLADAIAAAHKRGIAHRDLKPSNVMVDEEGRVKVLDFGIAKLIEEDVPDDEAATQMGSEALTEEGKIVGTVAYMSPEQAEGKPADHRTDIFSLGILMYEMCTGDRPFVGDTKLSILASIVKDDPTPIFERNLQMPRHLARIVKKALEKDVGRRYQSVLELKNDLIELQEEIDAGEILVTGGAMTDPGGMDAYRAEPEPASKTGLWMGIAGVVIAAAALGYAFLGGGEPAEPEGPPPVTVTQLTSTAGIDFGGTLSDDGDWFAFTRIEDGVHNILLQSVGSRTTISLVENAASPAFDPLGERIAFSNEPVLRAGVYLGGGISIMNRMGENRRQVTTEGFNPAWSPDGERIVFADEFVSFDPYTRQQNSNLNIVDVAGGDPIVLELTDGVQPSWSPNGQRIAYWGLESGQRDIWTVPAREGVTRDDAVRVTNDVHVDYSPVWAPSGEWLYFASTRGGSMAIWRIAIDQESGVTSGEAQQITSGGIADNGLLSFSADGSRLTYTSILTEGSIMRHRFDPETLVVSREGENVVVETRRVNDADISRDGEMVAYRTGGAKQEIFVASTAGGQADQITEDDYKDWNPRWSPDGTKLAFYTNDGGDYEVFVMNRDGTGRVQVSDTDPIEAPQRPVWSPDATMLATYVSDINRRSFILDATVSGGTPQHRDLPRVDGGDGVFQPTDWSADGEWLLGAVAPAPGTDDPSTVWRFHVEDETYEQLADGTAPAYLADQRRVIYRVEGTNPGWRVHDPDAADDQPDQEVDAPAGSSMVLSPDNEYAYLVVVDQEADIWLLEIGGQ